MEKPVIRTEKSINSGWKDGFYCENDELVINTEQTLEQLNAKFRKTRYCYFFVSFMHVCKRPLLHIDNVTGDTFCEILLC